VPAPRCVRSCRRTERGAHPRGRVRAGALALAGEDALDERGQVAAKVSAHARSSSEKKPCPTRFLEVEDAARRIVAPMGAHSTASMWPMRTLSRSRKRSSSSADGVTIVFPVASASAMMPRESAARTLASCSAVKPCASDQRGVPVWSSSWSSTYPWRAPVTSTIRPRASRRKGSGSFVAAEIEQPR